MQSIITRHKMWYSESYMLK